MRALVTGGSGFIGSHVVDKLLSAGHWVRVLDLKTPHRTDVEHHSGSILSSENVAKAMRGTEVVFHLAGFSNIDLVKDDPVKAVELNVMGTTHLLEASRHNDVERFILASSVYVHDERGHLYTTGKLASELLCKNYHSLYGLPYTILRYGTAYGPRSRDADVVSIFLQRALNGEPLIIRGTGEQRRNFIYVEDLAEASVAALSPAASCKTYVIAGAEETAIRALAEMVSELCGDTPRIERADSREDDYRGEVFDLDKVESELGWRPGTTLSAGLTQYKNWLESH